MYYFIQADASKLFKWKKANTAKHLLCRVKQGSGLSSAFSHMLQRLKANIHFADQQSTRIKRAVL